MTDKLYELTVNELSELIRSKQVTASEVTQSFLDRIEAVENRVKAYITITGDTALQQAQAVDDAIAKAEKPGSLAGIPGAIKDNISTRDILTTSASKSIRNYKPVFNATVMERLNDAGFVLTGKTNLDEFAMGSSTENSTYHATHNPWNLDFVPGGSSGGSAAAVAADECAFAIGSDTAGSIRQPASFCGVVGLKPTYGRVSRYGVMALASSMDHVGPVTKDVTDCALVMNVIAGADSLDAVSLNVDTPDFTKSLVSDVKGLKIGVPKEYFETGVDEDVRKAVYQAIDVLAGLGAQYKETSLPHTRYGLPAFSIISAGEISSNMAKFDGVRFGIRADGTDDYTAMFDKTRAEGFGLEVKQRIIVGTHVLSAKAYQKYYVKAQRMRTLIIEDFDKAFEEFDVLITPTTPTVAFKLGQLADEPYEMKYADICTVGANLAGIPAISIPCGFKDGLPIGLHIMGAGMAEETLLRVAYTYEQNTHWHKIRPEIG